MHKARIILSGITVLALSSGAALNAATDLRCEYLTNPVGIDEKAPRFTWKASAGKEGMQVIEVAESEKALRDRKFLWRSQPLPANTLSAIYSGKPLKNHTRYVWRVITDGKASETATFETAKMQPHGWEASWITDGNDKEFEPAPMLRKDFSLDRVPDNARAYISAAGYYVLYINGRRVGDSHMDPGYTHYDKRNLYEIGRAHV